MAFTYTPANISTGGRDWIRFRTGDINDRAKLSLTDEEIDEVLASDGAGDKVLAALICAKALKARAVRLISGGGLDGQRGELLRNLQTLVDDIASEIGTVAFAGGVHVTDEESIEEDDSLVQRDIKIGFMDNLG